MAALPRPWLSSSLYQLHQTQSLSPSPIQIARWQAFEGYVESPYAFSRNPDICSASLELCRRLGSSSWRLHARNSWRGASKSRKKVERAFAEQFTGEDDLEDEEEEDNNLDLLFQLFRNFVRKISSKATRIARAILPPALSTDVVAFSVRGVVLLSILWISKAFLEVVCAVGNAIFLVLLVIRSIWSVFTYIQSQNHLSGIDDYGAEGGENQQRDFSVPGAPA